MMNGDFTPLRRAVVQSDTLVLDHGREITVATEVKSVTEHLVLSTRKPPKRNLAEQAADQRTAKAKETVAEVTQPGKLDQLKHGLVMSLPYHPQYLAAGTVYTAVLVSPLSFGTVEPTELAPPGTRPAPETVLHARLLTPLHSAEPPRVPRSRPWSQSRSSRKTRSSSSRRVRC